MHRSAAWTLPTESRPESTSDITCSFYSGAFPQVVPGASMV